MSAIRSYASLIDYEIRKSLARKRILILLALTFLLEVGLYLVLTRLPTLLIDPFAGIIWSVGIIAPSAGLVHVLALTIGSATTAEEYETGTADYWFTRPISRIQYFIGKVVGGLALLFIIVLTYSVVSLAIAWFAFGPQSRLEVFPAGVFVSVFSALPFYTIGLAFGEVLRRSMMSTILSGTVFFSSTLIETYANIAAAIGNDPSLLTVVRYLPTWATVGTTSTILLETLDISIGVPGGVFLLSGVGAENLGQAFLSIVAYSLASLAIAWVKFRYSDVTRRAQ